MKQLPKLKQGDKVAILSPSFGAPAEWPHVHELGLTRLREVFGLEPIEFTATRKKHASAEERSADLIAAFEDPDIKAVIATLGGDDQVTYVKRLPTEPFVNNPKPFFGFSDNTHFENFLWLQGVPSYYGGCLFTQFAMQSEMDPFTVEYLKAAFFESGERELASSERCNDVYLDWSDPENLTRSRVYEANDGWQWDGAGVAEGVTWGGCLESIDEMLRHGVAVPSVEQFADTVLLIETSEEIPPHDYVHRVVRAFGERGWLSKVRAVLVGRPQAYNHHQKLSAEEKAAYRNEQHETILATIREYNRDVSVVQNLDFGHTNPQIAMPYGGTVRVDANEKKIYAQY